jgi:hypothetical protein
VLGKKHPDPRRLWLRGGWCEIGCGRALFPSIMQLCRVSRILREDLRVRVVSVALLLGPALLKLPVDSQVGKGDVRVVLLLEASEQLSSSTAFGCAAPRIELLETLDTDMVPALRSKGNVAVCFLLYRVKQLIVCYSTLRYPIGVGTSGRRFVVASICCPNCLWYALAEHPSVLWILSRPNFDAAFLNYSASSLLEARIRT